MCPTDGVPVYVYTRRNGVTCIRAQLVSDICLVDPSRVTLGDKGEVLCLISTLDPSFRETIEHVVFQLKATKITVKCEHSDNDLSDVVDQAFHRWALENEMLVDVKNMTIRIRR